MDSPGIVRKFQGLIRCIVIGCALGLAACGGGDDGDDGQSTVGTQPTQPAPSGIGAAGGTVLGPNGSKVEIPSGALAVVTAIAVDQSSANAPPLPAGLTPIGQMFAFTPHGTTFAVPVTVTMPFNPASVPAGLTPALFKTNAQNQWVKVANAIFGATSVSGQVTSFSNFQVVPEDVPEDQDGLPAAAVRRTHTFSDLINNTVGAVGGQPLNKGDAKPTFGTNLIDKHPFGPGNFDRSFVFFDGTKLASDDIAHGIVASTADGKSLQVATEAPRADANFLGEVVGSETELIQRQAFLKEKEDATLTFTMPLVRIETHDENIGLPRPCDPFAVCDFIKGEMNFEVKAFDSGNREFFHITSIASVHGFAQNWRPNAHTVIGSSVPFWSIDDFEFPVTDGLNNAPGSQAVLGLKKPLSFSVDLSSIAKDQSFQIRIKATAHAHNRLGGRPSERPTSAGAYINFEDPTGSGGGELFTTSGLKQIDPPADDLDPPPLVVPALPCGSNPGAGVLQFSAATYTTPERDVPPTVTVTRTGGSSGRVSATFTTIGGTATADSDFEPLSVTVFFADGDAAPRVVEIPIVEDTIAEPDETVELELSQPGGCVQLGPQQTAILTIVDDDAGPQPSGLDASFSGDGKATLEGFGGDRSGMAVQSDGKVIMVGGTFNDWVMARFKADGTLDGDFGDDGKVTTTMVPNKQQESLAVAIQPDDKIVVVGYTSQAVGPPVIALARYEADGRPDNTFDGDGKVISAVVGEGFAVALLPDGKILVAGDEPATEDFVLARFTANGSLDNTFASGRGFIQADIADGADRALNIALQSTGAIVISGPHTKPGESLRNQHAGLMRFTAAGVLDTTFGSGGALLVEDFAVGAGLAVQGDNKLVLAGNIDPALPQFTQKRFAIMRLTPNGSPDNSFGTLGKVDTSFTDRGDEALDVALQSDGKIVAAGRSNSQTNSNFAVARYESDGDLDLSFNVDGKLTVDFFGSVDLAENVAIQANGKIVVGGLARNFVDGYGVARIIP